MYVCVALCIVCGKPSLIPHAYPPEKVPTLVPAECGVYNQLHNGTVVVVEKVCMPHTLTGKLVTFLLTNYAFSLAIAMTMAVITGR